MNRKTCHTMNVNDYGTCTYGNDLPEDDYNELELKPYDVKNTCESDSSQTDTTSLYLREIGQYPLLSANEEESAAKLTAEGDQEARCTMITGNLRLVVSIAKAFARSTGVPIMELISEGNCGLIKAVDNFDYTKGYKFSTYATWWIKKYIMQYMSKAKDAVSSSSYQHDRTARMRKAQRKLECELERDPTIEEIAQESGLSVRLVKELLQYDQRPLSLDAELEKDSDNGTSFENLIQSDRSYDLGDPEKIVETELCGDAVMEALSVFSDRDRDIILQAYGFGSRQSETYSEIGKQHGLSTARVCQIVNTGLKKLRNSKYSAALYDFAIS